MNLPFSTNFRKLTQRLRYIGCWLKALHAPSPSRLIEREARRRKLVFQPLEPRVLLSATRDVTDGDGDTFQIKLAGPGTMVVALADLNGDGKDDIESIILSNSTEQSALTIALKKKAAAGDGEIAIGAITGDGTGAAESLGSLTALNSDLVGAGINFAGGTIDKIVLDDVRNGADIALPGASLNPKTTLSLTLGEITGDTDITSATAFGAITVQRAADGSWTAPSFGAISAKGGTLGASIFATKTAAELGKTLAVAKVSVTGGDFTGNVSAFGNVGPISAAATKGIGGAIDGSTISGAEITSVTAAKGLSADITALGALGAIKAGGAASGEWKGLTVGAVSVAGGDLTADIQATAAGAAFAKKPVIAGITVKGGDFNGNLTAPLGVGNIAVNKGMVAGGNASGSWTAATFSSIATKGGSLDAIIQSTATAASLGKKLAIGKLTVVGGNFTGELNASGSIGPVSVTADKTGGGNFNDAAITAANIGAVTIGATMSNSFILAGAVRGEEHLPGDAIFGVDQYHAGNIAGFAAGAVTNGVIGAGLSSQDDVIGNDDDELLVFTPGNAPTSIKTFVIKGAGQQTFFAAAGMFPPTVKIGGVDVVPSSDARFLTTTTADHRKPKVSAGLLNDTGISGTDGITNDPTIVGTVSDNVGVTQLLATFTANPADGDFVAITTSLSGTGFTLNRAKLEMVKGSALADGTYTLHLRALDAAGNKRNATVTFTLDTSAPAPASFDLSPASDTGAVGDHLTSANIVTLTGSADAGTRIAFGNMFSQVGPTGKFLFPNVPLVDGSNLLTLTATDVAGNASPNSVDFTRNGTLASNDVVLEWNAVNLEAVRFDATPPPTATRGMAMVSSAIFDVINAFEGTPAFLVAGTAPVGASVDAAVASAAYTVLSYLFPGQQAYLDASKTTTLGRVPDGASETNGVAFGATIGNAVIDLRRGDGFDAFVDYQSGTGPGEWQPTGPVFGEALLPQWANLQPFAMTSTMQFRPDGPPDLTSQEYTDAFNEVKSLGAQTGSTRTADQTQIARFWADGSGTYTPPGHWDEIAAQIGTARGNSVSANARLLAELNVAMADAAIVAWDAKYAYNSWRPETAIQNADTDGNDATTADPNWHSFVITPPFPEYISGHSTFSGAAATVLKDIFGDNVAFSTTSLGLPGVTRNFTSFDQAAQEAADSRAYGGIHFKFSNEDGLAAGRALGAFVHERFAVASDVTAPLILVTQPEFGFVAKQAFNLVGRAIDNISGLKSLSVQIDAGTARAVATNTGTGEAINLTTGNFTIPIALPLDGTAEGAHVLRLIAEDNDGNISNALEFPFTLDTRAPTLVLDLPVDATALTYTTRVSGTANPTGSSITSLHYKFDGGTSMPITFDAATGVFDDQLDLSRLAAGAHTLAVTIKDAAGFETTVSRSLNLAAAIPLTVTHMTPAADATEVGTTFRPQIFFSRPVNTSTLSSSNFFATDTAGNTIPSTVVPANDGTFAWLFFTNPMPSGANVSVHVNGTTILAAAGGQALDGDFDGTAGGTFSYNFTTVSLTPVEGTSLSGIVLDPGADLKPMTFDDMRAGPDGVLHTADDVYLNRLAGVKVFIVGLESQAVFTDSQGRFSFAAAPVGSVKLAVDGRTATNAPAGFYFPEMVMDLTLVAGAANTAMGTMGTADMRLDNLTRPEIYLPRLQTSLLQSVNTSGMTTVGVNAASAPNLTPEQRGQLQLELQPASLIGPDGQPMAGGQIGISTVPPELVRDMLPPGLLQHTFDITIQAPGVATFAEPAQMTFPNVFNSPPGTKLNFLSFDHTTGRLVIEGTATVSADGQTATTDPGFGITKPGWHGVTPPGDCGGSGGPPPPPPPDKKAGDTEKRNEPKVLPMISGEMGTFPTLSWRSPDRLPDSPPPPPPPPGCAVPARPPKDTKQQPFRNVTIEVDGPLAEFMKKSGNIELVSQSFTLSAGEGVTKMFGGDAMSYDKLFGGKFADLTRDQLYGSKVKVTEIYGNPDGSRSYTYDTYYLYRWVDVMDPKEAQQKKGTTAEFYKTIQDGTFTRLKFVDGHLPSGSTSFTMGGPFNSSDNASGSALITWEYKPTAEGVQSQAVQFKIDGKVVGTVTAKGRGIKPTEININKLGYAAEVKRVILNLRNVMTGGADNKPGTAGFDDDDDGIVDNNSEYGVPDPGVDGVFGTADDVPADDKVEIVYTYKPTAVKRVATAGPDGEKGTADDVTRDVIDFADPGGWVGGNAVFQIVGPKFFGAAEFAGYKPSDRLGKGADNVLGTADDVFTPAQLTALDAKLVTKSQEMEDAVKADYQPINSNAIGYKFVSVGGDVTMKWEDSYLDAANNINVAGGAPIYGYADGDADRNADYDGDALFMKGYLRDANVPMGAKMWVLAEELNTHKMNSGSFAIAINTPWNSGATFAQFVANTVSHEVGHTFGLIDAYSFVAGAGTAGCDAHTNCIPFDIMRSGSNADGDLTFLSENVPLLQAAMGMQSSVSDTLMAAVEQYKKTFNLARSPVGIRENVNPTGFGILRPTSPTGSAIVVLHGETVLGHDEGPQFDEFGSTVVDGAGGAVTNVTYQILNNGYDPLTLGTIGLANGSNGFSLVGASLAGTVIQPGNSVGLTLRFDPTVVGTVTNTLQITSDAENAASLSIPVRATGTPNTPVAGLTLANNNFGGVKVAGGTAANAELATITSSGAQALQITDIRIVEGSGPFTLTGVPANIATVPLNVAVGSSFKFGVAFDPTKTGLDRAVIEVLTNDPARPSIKFSAVGTGTGESIEAAWGNDYVAFETPDRAGGVVLRTKSNDAGNFDLFLPADQSYHLAVFDPATGFISHGYGTTPGSGTGADLTGDLVFAASTAPDGDGDGLPDDVEFAIGTSVRKIDTDSDGIRDFVEIQQNSDPLDGVSVRTGVLSSVALKGQAQEVVVDLAASGVQTAFVASGSHGLAIVDVTKLSKPSVLSELDLPGENNDVAVDMSRGLAAVAGGSAGLHLVNISDTSKPVLIQTVPFVDGVQQVELFDGYAYVATGGKIAIIDISTGEELLRTNLNGGKITGMAREGSILTTLDDAHNLRTVEIGDLQLTVRGSLNIPSANGQLFVGNGTAYLSAGGGFQSGFITANVSIPTAPTLISGPDDTSIATSAIVANGSGLGITVGTPAGTQTHSLTVVNTADLANTGAFITRFALPAKPSSVALSAGIAFVADGTGGLQIVNYRAFDDGGIAPTVGITSPAGVGNGTVNVFEGASIPVRVNVTDDAQVRQVDVLVNGNVVASDVAFPYDFVVTAPALAPGVTQAKIQVRATDTGGNEALSNVLTYGLLDDNVGPTVVTIAPPEGASVFFTKAITVRFSKPLDLAKLDVSGIHLFALGADGVVGGGDDVAVGTRFETRVGGRELAIFPAVPFDTGNYRLTVDPAIIGDRAGNALAAPVVVTFNVRSASLITPLSGTPAILRAPAANVGQEIGFRVDWDPSVTRVKFPTIDSYQATPSSVIVSPSRVDVANKTAFFIVPTNANTGDLTIYGLPGNNFTGFVNWNVTDGSVDLIGRDAAGTVLNDRIPTNGLYVDLDGITSNGGKLESKTLFNLPAGTYTLEFDLAGSQQGDSNDVAVSLGTVFNQTFTRAATDPFSTVSQTITVATATTGRLVFDQLGGDNKGALLGRVKLTNTTTGAVLINDNFDMTSSDTPLPLQIVPTLSDIDVAIYGSNYRGQTVRLRGSGFIEAGSTINFGTAQVVDNNPSAGPDIFFDARENGGMNVVAPADAQFGPITVTTAGGTSAPLELSLSTLNATAASGTPANAQLPSANPGQVITITGIGLDATTDIIFPTLNSAGTVGQRVVRPIAFKADGTEATVVVPFDAAGVGAVGIAGDRNNSSVMLQIVPLLENVDFNGIAGDNSSAHAVLRGKGFVEGNNSSYTFGGVTVNDPTTNGGPDVYPHFQYENDGVEVDLPTAANNYFGAVTVTTTGGTSAPFTRGFATMTSVAQSGTPANANVASANPGQVVTITGTGLTTNTDLIGQYIDGNGTLITRLINPTTANLAGTSASFVVPTNSNGVFAIHLVGSTTAPMLQIVPTLAGVDVTGYNGSRWRGLGFVEGNGTVYSFGGTTTTDTLIGTDGGANAGAFYAVDNDGADVVMPQTGVGTGLATITTLGGTSAAVPWNAINVALNTNLWDVALEPVSGDLFVATASEIKRINPATGATISSFGLPVQASNNIGLQVVPADFTLNATLVPAGSLLVTNGAPDPDVVVALNATTGATIASLTLVENVGENIDAVSGLYDPTTGPLFILDGDPNEVAEIIPATGANINHFALPIGIGYGGIARNPANGNLFIVSNENSGVLEMTTAGVVVRQVELSLQGVHGGELTGITFNAAGKMFLSSVNRSVVYPITLATAGVPAITQATITSINGVAGAGTAAGAGASANAGQIVEIVGTNFGPNTQVIFPSRDQYGNTFQTAAVPLTVNAAGTQLQVQVPVLATTGGVMVNNIGNQVNLGFSGYTDAIYRGATFNFTSTGTTSALHFADGGIQDIGDESWGIDNVKIFKVSDNSLVFSDSFESGANPLWTDRTVNSDAQSVFSKFLGRFASSGSTLNLTTLNATEYRVEFDFYALDSWDGNAGPDYFDVFAGNTLAFHESISNYTATNVQTFRAAAGGSVPLQVVPVITGINTSGGRAGGDGTFYLTGSGFQEGATKIRIGGVNGVGGVLIDDNSTADSAGQVYGNNDQYYDLAAALSLEGPIRIETAGGYFEIPGPTDAAPAFVEFTGLNATTAQGTPANPAVASANTGQTITLLGSGFTNSTRVQFDALDDNGNAGIVTRTGTANTNGSQLTVTVPALAKTGSVRVLGSATAVQLQIVPLLRSVGGAVTSGQSILLEGAGLGSGGLTVSIDGQAATVGAHKTIGDKGSFDQQVVDVTVPAGVTDGTVTVTTAGGSFALRRAVSITTQPSITPGADVGDSTGGPLTINLPLNSRVDVLGQQIGDGAFGNKDVDLYRFNGNAGDFVTINVARGQGYNYARLFNAAGTQLAIDYGSGPNTSARIDQFRLPATGTYFLGVSGYQNITYDPALAGSGTSSSYLGTYQLQIERLDAAASTLTGIAASATSGTAARGGIAAANTGQTITINGSGFATGNRIVFTTLDSGGSLGTVTATPTVIAADGSNLQVVVPGNATSGQVRLEREGVGIFLQIVPTLTDVTGSQNQPYHGANMSLTGSGFVEGAITIHLGGTDVIDLSAANGPDVGYSSQDNGYVNVVVPNGAPTGPISVTTLGGTSAVFDLTLTGITSTATSGTPANAGVASANPGQAITLTGTKFDATTDVIFQTIDGNGTRSERVVRAVAVNAAGTQLTVVVPIDVAVTGTVGIAGDTTNAALPLQIVPVLDSVDFNYTPGDGSYANVRLRGRGFVEGNGSIYRFGSVDVTDNSPGAGPNAGGFFAYDNDGVDLAVPLGADNYHGPISVTTAGGTSAPFTVGFTNVTGAALSGTPTNAGLASANPGQAVTITGTGLTTATDFIGQYIDGNGSLRTVILNPAFANAAGTSATLIVPTVFNGAFALHAIGSTTAPVLQIVPTLAGVDVTGYNGARWRGLGFVEGNGTVYSFGGSTTTDTSIATDGGANAGGFYAVDNDGADVVMPAGGLGNGLATIKTSGGTSAGVPWRAINVGLNTNLWDVALEPVSGNLFVATTTEIKRINPATGATISTFGLPIQASNNIGLQVVPSDFTLNATLVPAGSLLVTNGAPDPDVVVALNATTGAVIASLTLVENPGENIDAVSGLYDPTTGHLFILDGDPNEVAEINPATGANINHFALPIGIGYGGIARNPATGNLFIVSNETSSVVEMTTAGVIVRNLELSLQGVHGGELTGITFNAAGQMFLSSVNRSVVYSIDLATAGVPAIAQATLTSIVGTAAGGTAANGGQSSANAGQIIELVGTNFGLNTQVIFPVRDQNGSLYEVAANPLAINAAGTRLQVQVPAIAETGAVKVNNVGNQVNLGYSGHTDAIYRTVTIPFTASGASTAIRFADGGLQDVSDESWGIDNVRIVRVSDNVPVYSASFEAGAGAEWSDRATTNAASSVFTQFLGRFANEGSTLTTATTVNGVAYRLEFDFYALDSWDGTPGGDFFNVSINGNQRMHDSFANYSATTVQSFRASAGVQLQVVPVITSMTGRPGRDEVFALFGSGFMEGASTITIGSTIANAAGNIRDISSYDGGINVYGNNDQYYELSQQLTVEGPIRITTAGGFFDFAGPTETTSAFVEFNSLAATAGAGTPANPANASANTGQTITLVGRGFTAGTVVQFDAVGDSGVTGTVTRTGTVNTAGTQLTVTVPALARTGNVRVVGSATTIPLQIVPLIRSIGGAVTPGQSIVIEGTGLRTGSVTVSIDGNAAAISGGRIVSDRGALDQEILDVTVPAGATGALITVSGPGGSFTLKAASTISTLPDVAPGADVGDTIATALDSGLTLNSRVTITEAISDGTFGTKDVDLHKVSGAAGNLLTIEGIRISAYFIARLFNAAGVQLATDTFSGTNSAPRIAYFPLPATGDYFVGISSYSNTSYDPNVSNSGNSGSYSGSYQLKLTLQDGAATSVIGITSTLGSGTAARGAVAAANTGQTITINGTDFVAGDRIVFLTQNSAGDMSTTTVTPTNLTATSLQVVVPNNATSGTVRLERENAGAFLQVVPTIVDVDGTTNGGQFHNQSVRLRGTGFMEGTTTVTIGNKQVADTSSSSNTLDVFYGYASDGDGLNFVVPDGAQYGPISVTTLGGTSGQFNLTFTGFDAGTVASTGTPANAGLASANPGQTITLNGLGFDATTDVVFQTIDGNGTRAERIVRPASVGTGGTSLTVVVPIDVAFTGTVGIVGDKNSTGVTLQIVPVVESVDFTGIYNDGTFANARFKGRGFVEGNGTIYRFGNLTVTDDSANQGADARGIYAYDNDGADVPVALSGNDFHGAITITTAGGTSAPFTGNFTGFSAGTAATTGTAANGALSSANPGQTINITGSGLTTNTDIIGSYLGSDGIVRYTLINPASAAGDGSSATFVVPLHFNGVFGLRVLGSANTALLQIVPTLISVGPNGGGSRWRGFGFVEGNGTIWTINGTSVTDNDISGSPINVGAYFVTDNDGADVNLAFPASGSASVTTSGGTSAAFTF